MRVHLTGGSGFTGRFVLAELLARGHDVYALARSDDAAERLRAAGAVPVRGDLDDGPVALAAAFSSGGADVLVNVASLGFGHAAPIVAAADHAGFERAVFVSTTAIFTTLDATSKRVRIAAEQAVRSSSLAWTIVRPTMIYGTPDDRNMWRLLRFLSRAPAAPLPDGGRSLQQPVHVADLASAIVSCLDVDATVRGVYDVPGPEPVSFREIVEDACRAVGRFPRLVPVLARPAGRLLALAEGRGLHPPISAEQIERVLEDKVFDGSAATRDLGYAPRQFWVGIAQEAELGRERLAPGPFGRGARLGRTVALLDARQMAHRGRLRGNRVLLARKPSVVERRWHAPVGGAFGWPSGYEPLDASHAAPAPSPEANAAGTFAFLGIEHALGQPADWEPAALSQLWRYHLHYFEWAWSFRRHPDRAWARTAFAALWRSWDATTRFGTWDAWSPYCVALRAWSICGVFDALVRGSDVEGQVMASLARHAGYLRRNLELDVGGNHLVKDLKALVGLGCFLHDDLLVDEGCRRLVAAIATQVLPDGGHYERSPSYHCQVLGDLLDVRSLLAAACRPPVPTLDAAVASMQVWLGAMVLPGGGLSQFNDSHRVAADRLSALGPELTDARMTVLRASGYVVARPAEGTCLVVDVGAPCPPNLPAHAHADCLSFELVIDGRPALVHAGTSTYEPGAQRQFERSTAGHNTIEVDGTNQTEVWGQFRAGRRAEGTLETADDDGVGITIVGSHDGYRSLPGGPAHRRTFLLTADELELVDDVQGHGVHLLTSRLREPEDGPDIEIEYAAPGAVEEHGPARVAPDFGESVPASVHVLRQRVALPTTWRTRIRWTRDECRTDS